MTVQERHESIMKVLRHKPRLSMIRLQDELGISRSTLRRDLLELEHLGELVRRRGTVVHADYLKGEPTFDRRRGRRVEEKQAIARAAAALVPANASVYVDAGTTCLEVGRLLLKQEHLRLFTHSIRLVSAAADAVASVTCIGGEYRPVSDAVVGGLSAAWLGQLRFDIAFVAASGIDADGASTTELTETLVKQQIIDRATRTILVADSDKWAKPAAVRFAEWKQFAAFVSDAAFPNGARRLVRVAGVECHFA